MARSRSRSRSSASSSSCSSVCSDKSAVVAVAGQYHLTRSDQLFAASYVIPRTSVGCAFLFFCYFYYEVHGHHQGSSHQPLDLLLSPLSAYFGALLLWSRYESGWRRNVDILLITTSIFTCALHFLQLPTCADFAHRCLFGCVWTVGNILFVAGWSCKREEWQKSVRLHLCCHFCGWACWCLLYRCVSRCS